MLVQPVDQFAGQRAVSQIEADGGRRRGPHLRLISGCTAWAGRRQVFALLVLPQNGGGQKQSRRFMEMTETTRMTQLRHQPGPRTNPMDCIRGA
jgi:hypothetical protein